MSPPPPKSVLWALRHPKLKGRRVLKLAEVPLMIRRPLYLSTVILLILMAIYSTYIHISIYSAFQDGIKKPKFLRGIIM